MDEKQYIPSLIYPGDEKSRLWSSNGLRGNDASEALAWVEHLIENGAIRKGGTYTVVIGERPHSADLHACRVRALFLTVHRIEVIEPTGLRAVIA